MKTIDDLVQIMGICSCHKTLDHRNGIALHNGGPGVALPKFILVY
jgi:hypothetical protein